MDSVRLLAIAGFLLTFPASTVAQASPPGTTPCHTYFSIRQGKTHVGLEFSGHEYLMDGPKWVPKLERHFKKKLQKDYPGFCLDDKRSHFVLVIKINYSLRSSGSQCDRSGFELAPQCYDFPEKLSDEVAKVTLYMPRAPKKKPAGEPFPTGVIANSRLDLASANENIPSR